MDPGHTMCIINNVGIIIEDDVQGRVDLRMQLAEQ
jgi:hypothetical protein